MSAGNFLDAWAACAARAAQGLPPHVVEAARRNWFDTAAASAAGVGENCTRAARAVFEAPSSAWAAADAALVLGAASHALDYDDVCMLATCHPSAPVVAALLAVLPAAQRATTFGDMLAAYAVGTETMLRLGEWLGFRHYALGFHATSTLGSVGAAAAVAAVLRLDAQQAHHALSLGASMAAGLRANFGTDTKPLHVGFAAAAGIRAALLARAGAQASDDAWGPAGFPLAFNGGELPARLPWHAGTPWALEAPGFEHKRFPSCYMTHRLIAGILAIGGRHPQRAGEPVDITVELPHGGTTPLKHPRPATGLQAKFSGHYCAAQAWHEGRVGLAAFTDEAVLRPALRGRMERVRVQERAAAGETLDTAPVRVTLQGAGWEDDLLVDWAPGSLADPMTRAELLVKWRDCAAHGGVPQAEHAAIELLDPPLATPAAQHVPRAGWHALTLGRRGGFSPRSCAPGCGPGCRRRPGC